MNQHPFSVGQKVLCVFADFGAEVREVFDRLPQENCTYIVSEIYWGPDNATGQKLPSVRFMEIRARHNYSAGFSSWRFRLQEEELVSPSSPSKLGAVAATPDESTAAAISQAVDPTTEPARLALLSRDGPPSLGWMLAANPNTPGVVLHKLWKTHPLAALENPILAYQTLSTGRNLCQLLPLDVKLALYAALRNDGRNEEMEIHLPLEERCDWGTRCSGYRPRRDPEALAAVHLLVTDHASAVRKSMANHLNLSFLGPLTGDPEVGIRVIVARRAGRERDGAEVLMDILARDPEEEVRTALAGSSSLTPASHERLAADPSQAVRETLARQHQDRKDITETGWRSLVAGGSSLCLAVAENPSCHESVRFDLTAHEAPPIRRAAWLNFNFSRCLMTDQLAQRLDMVFSNPELEDERLAIAENSKLIQPVIERLLQCSKKVTRALAGNGSLPLAGRALVLRHHDDETVAIAIARIHGDHSKLMNVGFRHPSARVRAVVAALPGRRAAQLRPKLATDRNFSVRLSVCSYLIGKASSFNGAVIKGTLEILSRDPVAKIRARVVQDRRLPEKNLAGLYGDKSVRVRLQVLKHRCYGSRKDLGLLDHKVIGVRVEAARLIMRNQVGGLTRAKGKRTEQADPLPDLRIARDPSPLVRVVAAKSRNTSLPVLKFLIDDEAPEVQRTLTGRNIERVACPAYEMNLLETSRNPYERATAAGIYGVGKKRLHRLAADRCWYVRAMTARYGHKVDLDLLKALAGDPHPIVQECAIGRLNASEAALARPAEGGRP